MRITEDKINETKGKLEKKQVEKKRHVEKDVKILTIQDSKNKHWIK